MTTYKINRGDTFELNITLYAADGVTPWDLTGAKVWSTVKTKLLDADANALSQIDSAGGSTPTGGAVTLGGVLGTIIVRHAPAMSRAVDTVNTSVFYDVQVKLADGRIFTVEWGKLEIGPDVTLSYT